MIRKPLAALAVFSVALFLFPLVASAHVEIEAEDAPTNGVVATTIAAENECPDNGTLSSVELDFPATPALTAVTPAPVTGWSFVVTKGADGQSVSKIVWTNDGKVDGDGTFPVEMGTIPDGTTKVDFKALDTCDNGEVTRWVEPGSAFRCCWLRAPACSPSAGRSKASPLLRSCFGSAVPLTPGWFPPVSPSCVWR